MSPPLGVSIPILSVCLKMVDGQLTRTALILIEGEEESISCFDDSKGYVDDCS